MSVVIIIIIIIILVLIYQCYFNKKYESITGAVYDQLYSKGPMDAYLTTDTEKYIPEYHAFYSPYYWTYPSRYADYYPRFDYYHY